MVTRSKRKNEESSENTEDRNLVIKHDTTEEYDDDDDEYHGSHYVGADIGRDDPEFSNQQNLIANSTPTTPLEIALSAELKRRTLHVERLTAEISKLKAFISKRKQTYKRKRKEEGAPRKSLSAYNLFVRERFAKLAKENEAALKSADANKQLKRVPPASQVAAAGEAWRALSAEEKVKYEEMARPDRERYEEQIANYQPPEKQNRKRNKTGYNIFFSHHVNQLKKTESGVPSERGSVARIVGDAWKQMSAEEKDFYEREADRQNELHPMDKDDNRAIDIGVPPGPPPPMYGAPLPPHEYGAPPDYNMPGPPPVIHQPSGYDSRGYYGGGSYPPMHGGYDYYGNPYPPGPPPPGPPPVGRGPPHYPPPPYLPQYAEDHGPPPY
mmetsp:Transcript_12813/g.27001  ORF Transcript_12813/g.27001 Transcript_12813/m.27001 type:complete len:383 (+) Transcript_12813:395-1543(+)|eukprot:CAMPEP_0171340146 /NCGR_PEP_ID=MMETSP0878-20121228/8383_1 /TAXON_ID=67004 /ORGANISM="Thalassiosira weissflogii, Strain CCMP1336" /LENGTH=382 /DNA_ID=CAMNT_0011842171 /DNA_START=381 /DNA_END=1529 /DNA_ORIENTATION=+